MELGAALAHDDVAGEDDLAAEALDAEPLARRVAAVAGAAACFLVCHRRYSFLALAFAAFGLAAAAFLAAALGLAPPSVTVLLMTFFAFFAGAASALAGLASAACLRGLLAVGQDLGDAQDREVLAVAVLAAVVVAALLLEDQHLVALALGDDGGADAGAADERRADGDLVAVAEHQHLAELDDLAGVAGQALDLDHVVRGDLVLLAAGADDCEHLDIAEQCAKGMRGRSGPARGCRTIAASAA